MKLFFKFITTGLLLLICISANAGHSTRSALRDSLLGVLPNIKTSTDSLEILLNILDLSDSKTDRIHAAGQAYNAAVNARDTFEIIEAGLYWMNNNQNDTTLLKQIRDDFSMLQPSPRSREAMLYADFLISENRLLNKPLSRKEIVTLMREVQTNQESDMYEKARKLYIICCTLGKITRGSLYGEYVEMLMSTIKSLQLHFGVIRNLLYSRMAPIYTNNLEPTKAIEADKELLNIIDSLSTSYSMRGRKYRMMNRNRYICYRRLLCNYKALTPTEVEIFYRSIRKLAQVNEEIANDLANNPRIEALYLMANKKYSEAIPLLKKSIAHQGNQQFLYVLYFSLLEAAQAVDDKESSLEAALELNKILNDIVINKSEDRYHEIQIISNINDLQVKESEHNVTLHKKELKRKHILIGISALAVLLLSILIATLLRQNKKMKKLTLSLGKSAERLRKERNDLRDTRTELIVARDKAQSAEKLKDEFIDNISHEIKVPLSAVSEYTRLIVDCIPDNKNNYLQRFANIVELNTSLVLRLVDDLLDISSLEHNNMSVNISGTSVYRIAQVAMDSVFEAGFSAETNIKVVFNPSHKADEIISTDEQRVVQVLINLLSNARKFTEKGAVTLDYDIDCNAGRITFSVTDTGCGIPAGREEIIFGRFNKLDSSAPGPGIGLYISRLIARLLGGHITLDTTYRRGARFLFVIPI